VLVPIDPLSIAVLAMVGAVMSDKGAGGGGPTSQDLAQLRAVQGFELSAWPDAGPRGPGIYLAVFSLPAHLRVRGLGTQLFAEFLDTLPVGTRRVYLHASDMGAGDSTPFWESLGFDWVYAEAEAADQESRTYMVLELEKRVGVESLDST
jgi:hypothetical protein